jgi:hypothetical protein
VVLAVEERGGLVDVVQTVAGRLGRGIGRCIAPAEQFQQVIRFIRAFVGIAALALGCGRMVQRGLYLLRRHAAGHVVADLLDFLVGVIDVQEGGRVAQVEVGLFVLLLQDFEDAQVAANLLGHRLGEQVDDVRPMLLAVTVHTSIPLLETS